jgi:hypothetical protein
MYCPFGSVRNLRAEAPGCLNAHGRIYRIS